MDANARAVVIVGIPYPNVKYKQVELPATVQRRCCRLLSATSGIRCGVSRVEQAVGRCPRHRVDHGAILLADDRCAHGANGDLCRHLPKVASTATKCAAAQESKRGVRVAPSPQLIQRERASNPKRSRPTVRARRVKIERVVEPEKPRGEGRAAADEGEEGAERAVARNATLWLPQPRRARNGRGGEETSRRRWGRSAAIENGSRLAASVRPRSRSRTVRLAASVRRRRDLGGE